MRVADAEYELGWKKQKHLRLGFVGATDLAKSLANHSFINVCGIADPAAGRELRFEPGIPRCSCLEELTDMELDGLVVGPTSRTAAQDVRAGLEAGLPVLCQPFPTAPLAEVEEIVALAREKDRLLTVDFPYRCLTGTTVIRHLLAEGTLGRVFAADYVFHSPGPLRHPWFSSHPERSSLGDYGVHMLDLALWALGYPKVGETWGKHVSDNSDGGNPLDHESFAAARLILETGASIQVSCSRKLPAGCPPIIRGSISGTRGSVEIRNVSGSLTRFSVCHTRESKCNPLPTPMRFRSAQPVIDWARRLMRDRGFDPAAQRLVDLAQVLSKTTVAEGYGMH